MGSPLAALVALACAAPSAGAASAPLGVDTAGPVRALFLDMPLADARGAARPTLELRWSLVNSWSVPTTVVRGERAAEVQLDAQIETLQLAVAVPWRRFSGSAIARRLTTSLEAKVLARWGGWTDGGIEAWHRLVNSTNFDRERFPRDQVAVRLGNLGGATLVDARSSGLALGDVAVRTALRVAGAGPDDPASRWTAALRLDLKVPTGSPRKLGGSGGVDAGVGVAATFAATSWLTAHALGSVRAVSDLPRVALQPRRLQAGLDVSLAARLGAVTLLVEDRLSSPLFEPGWRLPLSVGSDPGTAYYALFRPHNQVSFGLRFRELTAFLSEDFTPGERLASQRGSRWFYETNAPDVALGIAWARAL
jgi:hypothetical protein